MQATTSIHTDVFFVGGGHTHAIVLRKIGMAGLPAGVRLTLITNLVDTPYSGMLPCHISGLYDFDQSHIDLRPLTRFANCRLIMDEVVQIDAGQNLIHCRHHPPMAYDVLSIDIGSTPAAVSVPGAKDHAIPAKPVPALLRAWHQYLQELQAPQANSKADPEATIGIVGGGVGGVELALNMQMRLQQLVGQRATVHLFHRGARLATGRSRATQRQLAKIFRDRKIHTHLSESVCKVESIAGDQVQVHCESGLSVACDRVFWVTNASAAPWLAHTGLSTDKTGFILVGDTLQTLSHPNVFAVGDVATMVNHPRPKAGVFAVRQGPPLYQNLQRYLAGKSLKPFKPQRQFLNIIDLGAGGAIASRGRWSAKSKWFRRWKHWIDGNFMALFDQFPAMDETAQTPPKKKLSHPISHHCAGCGSKVGSPVLSQALARARADFPDMNHWPNPVNVGLESPDDAAVVAIPAGKLAVQTVDQFRALVDDPYIFAQICVNHCLSDLYAMGATPQTVLALVTLPYGTDAIQTETLYQLMAGTYQALAPSQTWLVGGHTSEGPELALGFACNGWVSEQEMLTKQNLQPGLSLILTKPLGTGVLFAADMQRAAKGRWIDAAITSMVQSNHRAVQCLRDHGVVACTDVTGFGLLGHLNEMLGPGLAVDLNLDALPVLPGAHACFEAGYLSSLHGRNQQIEQQIERQGPNLKSQPNYPLLFDPQTSGGLLAAVPHEQVARCLSALQHQEYVHSRHIGDIVPAGSGQPPFTIRG
ncbi:selenide, water dikinase SelD [Leptolyngbya cf. ectocarpi LEGE 11479]|uniref:Selenide, water dikinase SelD n=1 Tax=Leptolyngbya cf. ectocarpi LEGE 11479 TaxID=1828722 RepID=A0A928ZSX0_LEPEC|nr:selenide, water dikinase SelD [Leptolyngbya ectocarpi]MBE9066972.1 selenide, water dikinase SelD [Leptolyngbya cf. ectocarpi LEGE 11479]